MSTKKLTRVVIVGRPNVGKSTLFNRLIGKRKSLVHNLPGVTRDCVEQTTYVWNRGLCFPFHMIDTGGVGGSQFNQEIKQQVQRALKDADLILFVLDAKTGVSPLDEALFSELRKSGVTQKVPIIGVVNKADSIKDEMIPQEYYEFEFKTLMPVSAEHNLGMGDLEDEMIMLSGAEPVEEEPKEVDSPPRIAIVGRPNVGKSSLVNALLETERMIVSPTAGTTVDPVDSLIELDGKPYTLIDTAGIRRKDKTEQGVEVLSVVQVKKTLEKADVAVLVLDAGNGISDQDEKIAGMILEAGCSVVTLMNKWDVHERFEEKSKRFTKEMAAEHIRAKMPFLQFSPLLFVSAHKKTGLKGLGSLINDILEQRKAKVSTSDLTDFVKTVSEIHNPGNAKFYLCTQTGHNPPTFVCHVSDRNRIHFSLERHMVTKIRERWGYMGSPVRLIFKTATGKPPRRREVPRKLPSKKNTNSRSVESTR